MSTQSSNPPPSDTQTVSRNVVVVVAVLAVLGWGAAAYLYFTYQGERDAWVTEQAALTDEVDGLQAELSALNDELADREAEIEDLNTQLEAAGAPEDPMAAEGEGEDEDAAAPEEEDAEAVAPDDGQDADEDADEN